MTCPEPAADGGRVQGGGWRTERDGETTRLWVLHPGSLGAPGPLLGVGSPQLAVELADGRPILHLAKEGVKQRAISGNKCWVLLLLWSFVRVLE